MPMNAPRSLSFVSSLHFFSPLGGFEAVDEVVGVGAVLVVGGVAVCVLVVTGVVSVGVGVVPEPVVSPGVSVVGVVLPHAAATARDAIIPMGKRRREIFIGLAA